MENCAFCLGNNTIKGGILLQNDHCYLVESIDPILQSAGMIITHRHVGTPFDLTSEEWSGIHDLLQQTKELFTEQHKPDGFNIGWNVGIAAGQNEPHVHLHVICRFDDEPLAGKGIRYALKQEGNRRPSKG